MKISKRKCLVLIFGMCIIRILVIFDDIGFYTVV